MLTIDYCWRSWTSRIAAPYKSRVDWLIDITMQTYPKKNKNSLLHQNSSLAAESKYRSHNIHHESVMSDSHLGNTYPTQPNCRITAVHKSWLHADDWKNTLQSVFNKSVIHKWDMQTWRKQKKTKKTDRQTLPQLLLQLTLLATRELHGDGMTSIPQ